MDKNLHYQRRCSTTRQRYSHRSTTPKSGRYRKRDQGVLRSLWRGNPVWENYIAFYTLLAGIIGAAAAAVPGLIDWATLTNKAAVKVANWHARVNITGLVIFIASFYLRTSSGSKWITSMPMLPVILSIKGVVGLGIAGWLGGELVFRHGVAVDARTGSAPQRPETESSVRAA
ncbi:MAG TPA: DUF2231 domain-containing protein [Pyrinomonadaceae bacterium]|nr:DUF2231 domain-containing protein [Pyrinomonadaceae bacterium]